MKAWGGISSLQLGLAAIWTEARARDRGIRDVVEWMCAAPARLAGVNDRKGSILAGYDADLVIWDPDADFTVDAASLEHKNRSRRTRRGSSLARRSAPFYAGDDLRAWRPFGEKRRGRWVRRAGA